MHGRKLCIMCKRPPAEIHLLYMPLHYPLTLHPQPLQSMCTALVPHHFLHLPTPQLLYNPLLTVNFTRSVRPQSSLLPPQPCDALRQPCQLAHAAGCCSSSSSSSQRLSWHAACCAPAPVRALTCISHPVHPKCCVSHMRCVCAARSHPEDPIC
jgi:hypothetical protein